MGQRHPEGHALAPLVCPQLVVAPVLGQRRVEVHPEPDRALSDGAQSLDFAGFTRLLQALRRLAEPLGLVIN